MENVTINSDIDNLRIIENMIDTISKKLGVSDEVYGKILISAVEAVNNAIIHGNKGDRNKIVKVNVTADGSSLDITVTDQGEGFDYKSLPDPTDEKYIENLHGRGVFIMRSLADSIEYNESGNEVKMHFKY